MSGICPVVVACLFLSIPSGRVSVAYAGSACPPFIEFGVPVARIALHFDSTRGVTELYVREYQNDHILRYDIAADLSYSVEGIPLDNASAVIAVDLDQDGQVELLTQWSGVLTIYSAPDWTKRASLSWPWANVVMHPVAINIDSDPYLEIFLTPHALGGLSHAVLIKYDAVADTFVAIADIPAPVGTRGWAAVGDFDRDGRMEFIVGNYEDYTLFEWQDSVLVQIGPVGEPYMGFSATACRPKPGGILHALLGHSSDQEGYRYQLLEPTGDNTFEVAWVFQEITGATGSHRCWAADTDCDGLDELAMHFYPVPERVWEWDVNLGLFVEGCSWDWDSYGTFVDWFTVDLDQNGAPEWVTLNHNNLFRAFPDPDCVNCDSLGHCTPPVLCYCRCSADPVCDSVTDVLDVVRAVEVAFRNGTVSPDPWPQCPPVDATDVDCDADTDVFDIVHLVNVAFRNEDPELEFCDPCP